MKPMLHDIFSNEYFQLALFELFLAASLFAAKKRGIIFIAHTSYRNIPSERKDFITGVVFYIAVFVIVALIFLHHLAIDVHHWLSQKSRLQTELDKSEMLQAPQSTNAIQTVHGTESRTTDYGTTIIR